MQLGQIVMISQTTPARSARRQTAIRIGICHNRMLSQSLVLSTETIIQLNNVWDVNLPILCNGNCKWTPLLMTILVSELGRLQIIPSNLSNLAGTLLFRTENCNWPEDRQDRVYSVDTRKEK